MPAAAIETRALRKVYPAPTGKRRGKPRASPPGMPPGTPPPTGELVALQALDLDIDEGEFFGLLGPNGAGKTTTIGILTTRVLATAGTARVSGVDVAEGLRGVMTPDTPHMSLGVVTIALVILAVAGWMLGMRSFYKRAIG